MSVVIGSGEQKSITSLRKENADSSSSVDQKVLVNEFESGLLTDDFTTSDALDRLRNLRDYFLSLSSNNKPSNKERLLIQLVDSINRVIQNRIHQVQEVMSASNRSDAEEESKYHSSRILLTIPLGKEIAGSFFAADKSKLDLSSDNSAQNDPSGNTGDGEMNYLPLEEFTAENNEAILEVEPISKRRSIELDINKLDSDNQKRKEDAATKNNVRLALITKEAGEAIGELRDQYDVEKLDLDYWVS